MTAWSNDCGYDMVFARQVEAFGRPGDVLLGISTSGRSRNLVRAFETAAERGIRRIALVGGDGGELRALADVALVVPSADTQHIQEVHTVVMHVLCELVEEYVLRVPQPAPVLPVRNLWAVPQAIPTVAPIAAAQERMLTRRTLEETQRTRKTRNRKEGKGMTSGVRGTTCISHECILPFAFFTSFAFPITPIKGWT